MLHTIRQVVGNDSTWRAILRGLQRDVRAPDRDRPPGAGLHQRARRRRPAQGVRAVPDDDEDSGASSTASTAPRSPTAGPTSSPGSTCRSGCAVAPDSVVRLTPDRALADARRLRSRRRRTSEWTRTSTSRRSGSSRPARPPRGTGAMITPDGPDATAAAHRRRRRGRLAAVRLPRPEPDRRRRARRRDRRQPPSLRADPARRSARLLWSTRSTRSSGAAWPAAWPKRVWVTREQLTAELGTLVRGRRLAVDYSPNGAIPYLDGVPAGVAELLRSLGATLVLVGGSGDPLLLGVDARRTSPRTGGRRRRSRPSRARRWRSPVRRPPRRRRCTSMSSPSGCASGSTARAW